MGTPRLPSRPLPRRLVTACLLAAWAGLLAAGFGVLSAHAGTPGAVGRPQDGDSPAGAAVLPGPSAAPGDLVVVLALHPRCPCTRSSLLAARRTVETARRAGVGVSLRVLARRPAGGGDWEGRGPDILADLPTEIAVIDDPGGAIASRLGALTSGHVCAFEATDDGVRPIYHGGVTPGRGHEPAAGHCPPLLEVLLDPPAEVRRTPVFGCPLTRVERGDD